MGYGGEKRVVYKLNPKQSQFFNSQKRHVAFFGGIGSGKTLTACLRGVSLCAQHPGTVGVVIRESFPKLNDSTKRVFLEKALRPQDWGKPPNQKLELSTNNNENWTKFTNGSQVYYRHSTDEGLFKGPEYDWFLVDQAEEITEEIAKRICERLRGPNCPNVGMWVGNTDKGHNWCYRWFKLGEMKNSELVETTLLDNADNLPKEYVLEQLSKPEEEKAIYIYGSWDNPGGLVLRLNDAHFVSDFQPPDTWYQYTAVDPAGSTGYCAALGFSIDTAGNIYFMREYYRKNRLVKYHAQEILNMWETKARLIYMDPSAWRKEQGDDTRFTTLVDRYRTHGIYAVPAENAVQVGIDMLRDLSQMDEEHRHPTTGKMGAPRIYFVKKRVPNLLEEVAGWMIEDPTKEPVHACDALRYAVASKPTTPISGHKSNFGEDDTGFMGA